ncbi:hypothetical protein ACSBR1_001036 [Camellia fascicularis]
MSPSFDRRRATSDKQRLWRRLRFNLEDFQYNAGHCILTVDTTIAQSSELRLSMASLDLASFHHQNYHFLLQMVDLIHSQPPYHDQIHAHFHSYSFARLGARLSPRRDEAQPCASSMARRGDMGEAQLRRRSARFIIKPEACASCASNEIHSSSPHLFTVWIPTWDNISFTL